MWKGFQPGEAPIILGLLYDCEIFVNLQSKLYWRWSCRLDNGAAMMPLDAECLWIFATETIYHTSQCGIVNCHEKYKLFFGFFSKRESFRKRLRKRREGTRPQHYAMPTCTGDFATKDGCKTFDDIKWWNEFESKKLPDIKHQAKKLLMNKAWPVARGEMLGAGAGLNIEWGAAAAGQSQVARSSFPQLTSLYSHARLHSQPGAGVANSANIATSGHGLFGNGKSDWNKTLYLCLA